MRAFQLNDEIWFICFCVYEYITEDMFLISLDHVIDMYFFIFSWGT